MGWLALVQCIMVCFTRRRGCSKWSGVGEDSPFSMRRKRKWNTQTVQRACTSLSVHWVVPSTSCLPLPPPPSHTIVTLLASPDSTGRGGSRLEKKHLLFGLKCTINEIKRVKKYNKKGEGKDSVYIKMSSAPSVGPLHRTPQVSTRSWRKTQKKERIMNKQTNHTLCTTN